MKAWIIGLALASATPFVWSWLKNNLPKIIAGWVLKNIRLGMAGGGVEDPDTKELLKVVLSALVRYAEKKLPDEGLGEQRMQLILGLLFRLPLVGPYIKDHEKEAREVIEGCIKEMDAELKVEIKKEAAEPPPPSGAPQMS